MAAAIPLVVNFVLHEYQRNRVLVFLDPESDPLGTGYHISQSKIAIGSGGIFGKGFLNGTQSHLDYLPEGHTDFALATMMEEWGLMGGLFVIIAFGCLIGWGISVSMRAKSRFGRLTAAGLSATIFFYVAINLMMVMGLAPVVGVPLPLVSFGGSAVMTVMLCLGLLMALVGLLIACVGVDTGSGTPRYTFDSIYLLSGIPFVEVMIGLFAVGEVLNQIHEGAAKPIRAGFKELMITKADIMRTYARKHGIDVEVLPLLPLEERATERLLAAYLGSPTNEVDTSVRPPVLARAPRILDGPVAVP